MTYLEGLPANRPSCGIADRRQGFVWEASDGG